MRLEVLSGNGLQRANRSALRKGTAASAGDPYTTIAPPLRTCVREHAQILQHILDGSMTAACQQTEQGFGKVS